MLTHSLAYWRDPVLTFILHALVEDHTAVTQAAAHLSACAARLQAIKDRRERVRNALRCLGHEPPAIEDDER
jgi:hypothetical protein